MPDLTFDLAAIRARCEKATPGPWIVVKHLDGDIDVYLSETCTLCMGTPTPGQETAQLADATFIAHTRTDLPRLLARLEEMQKTMESLKEELPRLLIPSQCGGSLTFCQRRIAIALRPLDAP